MPLKNGQPLGGAQFRFRTAGIVEGKIIFDQIEPNARRVVLDLAAGPQLAGQQLELQRALFAGR